VVAFWHFAQEKIDVAVLEAGLGGRLDAVTACKPAVTAITQIGFDHMEYLGHTLAAIAG
jgi:dihydrofolate synthase/folylpolyglutamate synthase